MLFDRRGVCHLELAASHRQHENLGLIDRELKVAAVEEAEHTGRSPSQPLVAVYQRVVAGEGMHERRGLVREPGIGVFTEDGGLGPPRGGGEQTSIAHRDLPEDAVGDLEKVRDAQVLDRSADTRAFTG